jgi:hypothetical protein
MAAKKGDPVKTVLFLVFAAGVSMTSISSWALSLPAMTCENSDIQEFQYIDGVTYVNGSRSNEWKLKYFNPEGKNDYILHVLRVGTNGMALMICHRKLSLRNSADASAGNGSVEPVKFTTAVANSYIPRPIRQGVNFRSEPK